MTSSSPSPLFFARAFALLIVSLTSLWLGLLPDRGLAATTAVCGFNTVTLPGSGAPGSYQFSFSGISVVPVTEYAGKAASFGTNTLVDSTAGWVSNPYPSDGTYYVEITSVNGSTTASGVGSTYTISAANATTGTLTLAANLTAGMTAPIGYTVRKHWTIGSLFGATNAAGLTTGLYGFADTVLVWTGGTNFDAYYYLGYPGGSGWRKSTDASTDASGAVIRPENCLITRRLGLGNITFKVSGMVKTGQTAVTVAQGNNYIPSPYAVSMTLSSCGIYTGNAATGLAPGSPATADQVLLWNGSGYDTYYYQNAGIGGTGWRKIGNQSADASATAIAAGTGFIIRRNTSTSFTWAMPQHPASL